MQTVTVQMLVSDKFAAQRKQFFEYDGSGNITGIYYAQANASGGESCLKQAFEYTTVSGQTLLEKTTWQPAVWSGSSWDI